MSIERLREIEETLKRYPESLDNLPVIWWELGKELPKILALVQAALDFADNVPEEKVEYWYVRPLVKAVNEFRTEKDRNP